MPDETERIRRKRQIYSDGLNENSSPLTLDEISALEEYAE
jgi:hypothetical protein